MTRAAAAPFDKLCKAMGIPAPVAEFRFHPTRKWRADFAWPDAKVLLEVEGGIFIQGRHSRGTGMQKDMEKYNNAALLGYRVLRCTPKTLTDPATFEMLRAALERFEGGR